MINKQQLVEDILKQFNQTTLAQNYYINQAIQKTTELVEKVAGKLN